MQLLRSKLVGLDYAARLSQAVGCSVNTANIPSPSAIDEPIATLIVVENVGILTTAI